MPTLVVLFGLALLTSVNLPADVAEASSYCGTILRPWDNPPPGDRDCDGFSNQFAPSHNRAGESYLGTYRYSSCSATPLISDEAASYISDSWPTDFNDNQITNVGDVLKYNSVIGGGLQPVSNGPFWVPGYPQPVPGERFDLNQNGIINTGDVLMFNWFMNKNCLSGIPPAPAPTTSRYIKTVDRGTHYNLGCGSALANESGALVLAFGQPYRFANGQNGTRLQDGPATPVALSQIISATQNFASGYYNCTPSGSTNYLRIVMGTSNYIGVTGTLDYNHGVAWAQAVTSLNQFIGTVGWAHRVGVVGGSDIELGWSAPGPVISWSDGYNSAATAPYYDFGDAAGCPTEYVGNIVCSTGWTVSDVWLVAWHNLSAWPFPEIYSRDGVLAAQWQALSLFAAAQPGFSAMHFDGVLTQQQACFDRLAEGFADCFDDQLDNPSNHGWRQLWTLLNADFGTQQQYLGSTSPPRDWASDITWDN